MPPKSASRSGGGSASNGAGAAAGSASATQQQTAALLQRHEQMRQQLMHQCATGFVTPTSFSHYTKLPSASATAARLQSLQPIGVADLRPGHTHRGAVLRGRLLVDSVTLQGTASVLEDEHGVACRIGVYNLPEVQSAATASPGKQLELLKAGQRAMPKGAWVSIIEPFYKVAMDGHPVVRVEDPDEFVVEKERPVAAAGSSNSNSSGNSSSSGSSGSATEWMALKEEGNRLFAGGRVDEAFGAFGRALQCDANVLSSVASNVALCELQQNGNAAASLRAALIAVAADGSSSKVWMRAAAALEAMAKDTNDKGSASMSKAAAGALWCAEHAVRLAGPQSGGVIAAAHSLAQPLEAKHTRAALLKLIPNGDGGRDAVAQAMVSLAFSPSSGAGSASEPGSSSSSSAAASSDSAVAENKRGGELYKAGSRAEAFECYRGALRQLAPRVVLLSNRALCLLKMPNCAAESLLDAAAATVLDPRFLKAYHRQAEALLVLHAAEDAAAACQRGLDQCTAADAALRSSLEELKRRAVSGAAGPSGHSSSSAAAAAAASAASAAVPASSSVPSNQFPSEAEQLVREEMLRGGPDMDGEQQAMMNQVMEMMQRMSEEGKGGKNAPKMIDERIQKFHKEYDSAGQWPRGVDQTSARSKMASAYETARAVPMHEMMLCADSDQCYEKLLLGSLLKRLGCVDEDTLGWFARATKGDVRFLLEHLTDEELEDSDQFGYHDGFHSFSNDLSIAQVLSTGTTHVAVGFVDLGLLCVATLHEDDPDEGPLRFVAYDQSPPCVAKTIVLVRMMEMKEGGAAASSSSSSSSSSSPSTDETLVTAVLECWYSATWRPATLSLFRRALTLVLEDHASGKHPQPAEVLSLLRHWQHASVSLREARAQWLRTCTEPVNAANFRQAVDRAAYLSYSISGDVLPAQADSTPSVLMFALPEGVTRVRDESIFNVVPMTELLARRPNEANIVAAAASYLRVGIARLCARVRAGLIWIEPRLGRVELGSAVVPAIALLRPYTMSWSNVLDYMRPREFWSLARSCCALDPSAVHFASSMNWPMAVFGSCALDSRGHAGRAKMVEWTKKEMETVRRNEAVFPQAERWLLQPPVDNVMNTAGFVLAQSTWRRWLHHFSFRDRAGPVQIASAMPHKYNFLARQCTTMSLTFTFDMSTEFVDAAVPPVGQ